MKCKEIHEYIQFDIFVSYYLSVRECCMCGLIHYPHSTFFYNLSCTVNCNKAQSVIDKHCILTNTFPNTQT